MSPMAAEIRGPRPTALQAIRVIASHVIARRNCIYIYILYIIIIYCIYWGMASTYIYYIYNTYNYNIYIYYILLL